MATKKRAKKRLPRPVPCECWCVYTSDLVPTIVGDRELARRCAWEGDQVIRVRIVPVVAKRRKGAK